MESPLAGLVYSKEGRDLVRFRPHPVDSAVGEVVERARHLGPDTVAELQSSLTESDMYLLIGFAMRQALWGLREGELGPALLALYGLALVDREQVDARDLWWKLDIARYAVRELGGDVAAAVGDAAVLAVPATARDFEDRRCGAGPLSLAACGLMEVTTSYGRGFIDKHSGEVASASLVETAVSLQDRVDLEGTYATHQLRVSGLPEVWLMPGRRGTIPTLGCVSFSADHVESRGPFSHGLLVFLADLPDEEQAGQLEAAAARASKADRPQVGLAVGRRFALLIGGSSTAHQRPRESVGSLGRFTALVHALLAS